MCLKKITKSDISHAKTYSWNRINFKDFKEVIVSSSAGYGTCIFFVRVEDFKDHSSVISLSSCQRWVEDEVRSNFLENIGIRIIDPNFEITILCSKFFHNRIDKRNHFFVSLNTRDT